MTSVPSTPTTTPSNAPGFFQKNKIWFIVIGLFILSNAGVYFYQNFQKNRLRKSAQEEMARKYKLAEEMTQQRNVEMAGNLCRALIWGIRGEMERGNKGQIDLFMNRMVQETGLELVLIQNAQDSIYLSTDKNYENHKVRYLQHVLTEQKVLNSSVEEAVVAAPIMGTEARLGTCLVIYRVPQETQDMLKELATDSLGIKPATNPK